MDLGLAGKRAIVFGAASGIGAAIARSFIAERADTILVDRDPRVLELGRELDGMGAVRSMGFVADVTDFAAVTELDLQVSSTVGPVDHLVFAVGAGSGKFGFPFWKLAPGEWERVIRINLIGAVNVAHAFAPRMVDAAREEAVNAGMVDRSMLMISSVAGQIGSQTDPPYSAAKAALINFAQCAAKDLAPFGIRVNTVCPGMVRTPLNQSVYEAWAREQPEAEPLGYEAWAADKIKKVVPLNRWQETDDIAAMAVFLASSRARNITGQTMNVDGGFVMHW